MTSEFQPVQNGVLSSALLITQNISILYFSEILWSWYAWSRHSPYCPLKVAVAGKEALGMTRSATYSAVQGPAT